MQQISKFYDKYQQYALNRPPPELVGPDRFSELMAAMKRDIADDRNAKTKTDDEVKQMVKKSILEESKAQYLKTEAETRKRWFFEDAIKRPYFHYVPLENSQVASWHRYLDFEEKEGQNERIEMLYKRCLIACVIQLLIEGLL